MKVQISHLTRYRYEYPVRSILQMLRLMPGNSDGQHAVAWRIEPSIDGCLRRTEDPLGNIVHVFSAEGPVNELSLRVSGEVLTTDTGGVVRGFAESVPEAYFLRDTPLTQADGAIRTFAQSLAGENSEGGDRLTLLHRLLAAIHRHMRFDASRTDVATSAAHAFALGEGVCQDLSHIFLAAARYLEIPSRYVSGYFVRNDGIVHQDAGHAWVEAFVPGLGWVGFDPANGICPTDAHVRVAIGLDYLNAAPIRGSRRGGGAETLDVRLKVASAPRQVQS